MLVCFVQLFLWAVCWCCFLLFVLIGVGVFPMGLWFVGFCGFGSCLLFLCLLYFLGVFIVCVFNWLGMGCLRNSCLVYSACVDVQLLGLLFLFVNMLVVTFMVLLVWG